MKRFAFVIALAGSIGLAGCTINIGAPGTVASDSVDASQFSANDLMFAAMMIPHHQQAVKMSNLALERSTNPELLALAKQIKAAQQPEIEQMQAWLDQSGSTSMSSMMAGHDHGTMGGMLDDSQMAALAAATGTEFDRLYLEGMIAHHQGAIEMAAMVASSANPQARALGEAIISSQTAEIATMRELLAAV